MVTTETERDKKMAELRSLLDRANALFIELTGEGIECKIKEETLDNKVSKCLHSIGVPAHIRGYKYLKTAMIICIEEPSAIQNVTKYLYPTVAEFYHSTSSRVERGMTCYRKSMEYRKCRTSG